MKRIKRDLYFDYLYNRFLKSAQLRISSGCADNCQFCDIPHKEGEEVKFLSSVQIKKRLKDLWEEGYRHIDFNDDNFLLYGEEMKKILKELVEKGYGFTFSFNAPVKRLIHNQKLLTPLKHLGLRAVTLQLINSNQKVLERYGLDLSPSKQEYAIQILQALQIQIELDYILFDPMTSIDYLKNDYQFLEENKLLGIAPFTDVLTTHLDLADNYPLSQKYRDSNLYLPSQNTIQPYQIFEPQVEEVFYWMLLFEKEYGQRWYQSNHQLQEIRIKLAKEKPNWKVTNMGQELMHITFNLRLIPYLLFKIFLSAPGRKISEKAWKSQCEKRLTSIEDSFWKYRKCHKL